jgi:deazaflavin-dependent oxidoreductase (nitroreductase family)
MVSARQTASLKYAVKRRLTRIGNRCAVRLYGIVDARGWGGDPGAGVLVVTVAGRRTNAQRSACVRYLNTSEGLVVWGTGSGSPRDPDWFENLRRATVAHVRVGAERQLVIPRELLGEERNVMWNEVVLVQVPEVAKYARRAHRTIPVAILAPPTDPVPPRVRRL